MVMGLSLEQYFSQPKFSCPRRLLLSIEGPQKVGKTTLGLSALLDIPERNLAMIDYDFGGEGVINNFDQSKIWYLPLDSPHSMWRDEKVANEEYKKAWERAKGAYYAALSDSRVKTILVDTATEFREAQILGHFGKLAQIIPRWYSEPNGEFRKLIRDAYERLDLNLILIHTTKDEYINDTRTGKRILSGFQGIPGLVQMAVKMWKREKEYGLTIVDCRHKRALEGTELPAAVANFPMLLSLAHGPEPEKE